MLTVVVANAADLCTFYLVTQLLPITAEANPLAVALWEVSPWLVALFKGAGVVLALLILRRLHSRIARWGTAIAVAVPMLGVLTNTASGLLA